MSKDMIEKLERGKKWFGSCVMERGITYEVKMPMSRLMYVVCLSLGPWCSYLSQGLCLTSMPHVATKGHMDA